MQMTVAGWCGPVQSELFASWTEAIATVVAAVAALLALIGLWISWLSAKAQFRAVERQQMQEAIRDGVQADEKAREQADQVAAWLAWGTSISTGVVDAYVTNRSLQPVYRFAVRFQAGDEVWGRPEHPWQMELATLPPVLDGRSISLAVGLDPADIAKIEAAREQGQPYGVCVTFTDIAGRDWSRQWNGALVRGRNQFAN